jgi:hypothetical protein
VGVSELDQAEADDLDAGIAALTDEGDPVQVALDYVQGVLLGRIADPVKRWDAVTRFTAELPATLDRVRGLSVGQLVHDDRSVQEAANMLGITRQRANAVMTGEGWPTPRQEKHNPLTDEPGYRFGVFLGVASVIADRVDVGTHGDAAKNQLETLMLNAHVAPGATRAQVAQRITSWVRRRPSSLFRPLMDEFDKALLSTDRLPRQLTQQQQGHMWVARSATRVRLAS